MYINSNLIDNCSKTVCSIDQDFIVTSGPVAALAANIPF